MGLSELKRDLKKRANNKKAKIYQRFFKTGPGEYGEGDLFLGITVPHLRALSKEYISLSKNQIQSLIKSPYHEERLLSLFILVEQFKKAKEKDREKIYKFYVRYMKYINNWDLIDTTAAYIVGAFLENKNKAPLYDWAKSSNLWKRRISIISTFHFIKMNRFQETLRICGLLLEDDHDLIHKACGWMLREIGKRDLPCEEGYLKKNYPQMPRTMLRYAIERFPEKKRQAYLKGNIPTA